MKTRMLAMFVFVVGLVLLLVWSVTAQKPEPPGPAQLPERLEPSSPGAPTGGWEGEASVSGAAHRQSDLDLGQPGLSFRYVQTFGESEVAYYEDTSHIVYPFGVGTDGTHVWIADSDGVRALKFTHTGSFVMQIGQAGFSSGVEGTDLGWIADVAVDSSGNIWVVDGSASHVAKFDAGGNLSGELGVPWEWGSDNHHFAGPRSIAFDNAGNMYVSDAWNHRIQVFDSGGNYLATIGETGVSGSDNAHLNLPRHIAIDDSDLLYVPDALNHRVQIFDVASAPAITYVGTIGVTGEAGSDNAHFNWPSGVAVDAGRIYVADDYNHRVQIFGRSAPYTYQGTLGSGSPGSGNDQLNYPVDVAIDSAGNIYVADLLNMRVQQFNSGSLVYVRTFGVTGVPYLTDGFHYNQPSGVAVAPDGSILLTEEKGRRLVKLSADGAPQWAVGEAGVAGDDNSHFDRPHDVDLDSNGRVYVADAMNHRVQIFSNAGLYLDTLGAGYGGGNYQFNEPRGLAVDTNGNIYVADRFNHRVQIYASSHIYVATIGETGVSGVDNTHLNEPYDVAVDLDGNIYVVENANHRVQVFDSNRVYVRTIGESGVAGSDFGHLENPTGVAVDETGRIYVADGWGGRIQVFDNDGAYLTTVGGSWGSRSGELRQAEGLAVDGDGNLYVTDALNHRIQKFAPGVPGWQQVNINGFGNRWIEGIPSLSVFENYLYAGTANYNQGSFAIWRTVDGNDWQQTSPDLGSGVSSLAVFSSYLYAGTWNGTVWRSADGLNWTNVITGGFGNNGKGLAHLSVYSDTLYAGTYCDDTTGGEIWKTTNGTTWNPLVSNGLGDPSNCGVIASAPFGGQLYFGIGNWNGPGGAQIWRTNGVTVTAIVTDGFGVSANKAPGGLAVFNGALYASVSNANGIQVWRSSSGNSGTWTQVVSNGFGNSQTNERTGLIVHSGYLYLMAQNSTTGMEVWYTANGTNWEQVGLAGFGDSNNEYPEWSGTTTVFNESIYIGVANYANGGEIWEQIPQWSIYLPLVLRNH